MTVKTDLKKHWDKIYAGQPTEKLGWHEENPAQTLHLVEKSEIKPEDKILVVGAGSSTLIDYLLQSGFKHVVANDISRESLSKLQTRIGPQLSKNVVWVVDDLTSPELLPDQRDVALWIDRAVLHFLTKDSQKDSYFRLLKKCVMQGGYVIFGEFSLSGVTQCAGLPVLRYSREMLQERLGKDFYLIEHFEHTYMNPSGSPRQYIYILFQRRI